jgi:hypothetical protein
MRGRCVLSNRTSANQNVSDEAQYHFGQTWAKANCGRDMYVFDLS